MFQRGEHALERGDPDGHCALERRRQLRRARLRLCLLHLASLPSLCARFIFLTVSYRLILKFAIATSFYLSLNVPTCADLDALSAQLHSNVATIFNKIAAAQGIPSLRHASLTLPSLSVYQIKSNSLNSIHFLNFIRSLNSLSVLPLIRRTRQTHSVMLKYNDAAAGCPSRRAVEQSGAAATAEVTVANPSGLDPNSLYLEAYDLAFLASQQQYTPEYPSLPRPHSSPLICYRLIMTCNITDLVSTC